jgi:hypothetical protein
MQTVLVFAQIAIPVLLVIGGLWLRHVVNQQLSLKDSENQALRAENERLTKLAAPSVAGDLEIMSKALETYSKKNLELEAHQETTGKTSYSKGLAAGLTEGATAIGFVWGECIISLKQGNPFFDTRQLIAMLQKIGNDLVQMGMLAREGGQPQLLGSKKLKSQRDAMLKVFGD